MIERAYRFGKDGCLAGVATSNGDGKGSGVPAVVFLNAGLLHHVGPHRLHVDLARKLASRGAVSLRLDLAGLGDSGTRSDSLEYEKRAVADIRDAMDFLGAQWGIARFVLFGLCSGADNAHAVALEDSRVCGIVLLDGYAYRTRRFYLEHVRRRALDLLDPMRWQNLLRRKYRELVQREDKPVIFAREFPARERVQAELEVLARRGVRMKYVYSGDAFTHYNYPGQFREMFDKVEFGGSLDVNYFREADHTFSLLKDRATLMESIADWYERSFGKEPLGRAGGAGASLGS